MATNALYGMCIALYLDARSMHVVCCSCSINRNSSAHLLDCLRAHCAPHSRLHVFKRCQQRFNLHIYAIPGQSKTINTTSSWDCSAFSLSAFSISQSCYFYYTFTAMRESVSVCLVVCVVLFTCILVYTHRKFCHKSQ